MGDRNDRGKNIMRPPSPLPIRSEHDRTFGWNVTSSKRRLRVSIGQSRPQPPPPPLRREADPMVMMPTLGYVTTDSEELRSREYVREVEGVLEEGPEEGSEDVDVDAFWVYPSLCFNLDSITMLEKRLEPGVFG